MKVKGTYQSVIRGVSQQAPADRIEGQHGEVVNMLSDPVRGLVRRNGFHMHNQRPDTFTAEPDDALVDSYSFRAFSYQAENRQFDVLYRSREKVGDSDAHLPALLIHEKNSNGDAVGWKDVVRYPGDTGADAFEQGGLSAITAIGSYVLMAGNSVTPSLTQTDDYGATIGTLAIWVRGGTYSRSFRVRVKRRSDGAMFDVTHTTMASAYPEVFNFVDAVPIGAIGSPFEQYFINFAQAQYDTKQNQWIAAASASIVPNNIAQALADKLTAAGMGGWSIRGSHILHDDVAWVDVNDGGNGEMLRAVLSSVKAVDDLTDIHRIGKVVQIKPSSTSDEVYYLKAYPKVEGNADPFQTVVWREAAGTTQTPQLVVAMGRVVNNTFYWASTPSLLNQLLLDNLSVNFGVPTFQESRAGDWENNPAPNFYGKRITLLVAYQDRLGIGSNNVMNWSETGNYFNFFRTTMLTVPDSDAVAVTPAGTDGDVLRRAVQYDGNLMLFGDRFHYTVPGRSALTASAPNVKTAFSITGTAWAQPVGLGKYVFFLKEDSQLASSRLMQVQAGAYQDSPELNDLQKQLRDYVNGSPAELVALANPSIIFVRTEHILRSKGGFPRARPWGLYVFQYLEDDAGRRVQEAWSAWEWSTAWGTPIGITDTGQGDSAWLYTVSFGTNEAGQRGRIIYTMKMSARSDPSGLPYLDGLRAASDSEVQGLITPAANEAIRSVVWTAPSAAHSYLPVGTYWTDQNREAGLEHPHYTVGDAPPESVDAHRWDGVQGWLSDYIAAYPDAPADSLYTGTAFPAYVDLTNPFMRDQDGKLLVGQLNLTSLYLTLTRTAGFKSQWIDHDGTVQMDGFNDTYSRISYEQPVWIGRESKDVQVRISAVDFKPLTINAIAWKGNWFGTSNR